MNETEKKLSSGTRMSPWKVLMVIVGVAIASAIVIVPLAIWLILGTTIRGEEFCPHDFSQRTFSYSVNPISGKQTKGVTYVNSFAGVSAHLVDGNYLQAAPEPKTWHLLRDNKVTDVSADTESRILSDYLNQTDAAWNMYWVTWTDEHPNHARIFWPAVSQMAVDELYVNIPTVMEFARRPGDSKNFEDRLFKIIASNYAERAADAKGLGNEPLSKTLYDRAVEFGMGEEAVGKLRGEESNGTNLQGESAENDAEVAEQLEAAEQTSE